ncbi:hypothetical protein PMIN03_008966 [Paraphaeosphaeria minitans]
MPRFPVSPYWSSNPNIPIYLDAGENYEENRPESSQSTRSEHSTRSATSLHPRHIPEHICPNCNQNSRDTPIHCVSVAHPPAPPSYSSVSPAPPPPPSPRHLTVPVLTVETPRHWSKPQAPGRSLQFDPEGRPNVRFRRNAFSPLSPTVTEFDEVDWSRKSQVGLGIEEASFRPDTSPITPGTAEKRGDADAVDFDRPTNWAQRVEQKLWNYTASRSVVKRWLLEIISWSLSALCMASIVIMLLRYQDKRIPRWPLGLTLNAYISVMAKIASAALLLPVSEALGQLKWSWFQGDNSKKMWDFEIFDNASRGPWGSLLLIVRTKGRSLAALGACVTIMALLLDPFFQQVVEYPEHWRIQPGNGSIPRATGYEPFSTGKEFMLGLENVEVDQTMLGIQNRFFYSNGTLPMTFGKGVRAEVPLGCPNSNCTWPEYESFGVSSECLDASDRLEFRCSRSILDWVQEPVLGEKPRDTISYSNGSSCGWWLKAEDPLLMTGYNIDKNSPHTGEILLMRAQPLYDLGSRRFMPGYLPKLNNSRNPLAHVVIVSNVNQDRVRQNSTPIANECMVSWSAKRMISTYSEGGYEEIVSHIMLNSTVEDNPWISTELFDENNVSIGFDFSYGENVVVASPSGDTYRVDNRTHTLAVSIFDDMFPSSYTMVNTTNPADAMLRYKQYLTLTSTYRTRNVTYNPFLYANISLHLEHMSNAMTNAMRSATSDTENVMGQAFDLESFVEVRWPWLTLPFALLVLTGIFLLATVFRSSHEKEHVGVWKTSAIATLLYGLPDDMSKKMTASKTHGTPRMKAKEVKVKWIPKGGWRFSGVSISPTSVKARQSHAQTSQQQ